MNLKSRLLAVLLAIAVNCQGSAVLAGGEQGLPVEAVKPKAKDAPLHAYVITWRFEGTPAPVQDVSATADFEVENRDCVPLDHSRAVGGVRLPPLHSLPATVLRTEDGGYTATVYADALQDENYFQRGTCRWKLNFVHIRFGSPHSTRFVGAITDAQLREKRDAVLHYLISDFEKAPPLMNVVFGEKPDFYRPGPPQFVLRISVRGGER